MFTENQDFYPTPNILIEKMINSIDFKTINTVLEPSAGSGAIVEKIIRKLSASHYSYNKEYLFH